MADIKPVFKRISGEWKKQKAYERVNGDWVLISSTDCESDQEYLDAIEAFDDARNAAGADYVSKEITGEDFDAK